MIDEADRDQDGKSKILITKHKQQFNVYILYIQNFSELYLENVEILKNFENSMKSEYLNFAVIFPCFCVLYGMFQ